MNNNHVSDWVASFIGGGTLAAIFTPKIWFESIFPPHIIADIAIKISVTILVSLIGGIVGMFGKEFYSYKISPLVKKWFKKKK